MSVTCGFVKLVPVRVTLVPPKTGFGDATSVGGCDGHEGGGVGDGVGGGGLGDAGGLVGVGLEAGEVGVERGVDPGVGEEVGVDPALGD